MNDKFTSRYKKWIVVWVVFITLFIIFLLLNQQILGPLSIYTILTQNLWLDFVLLFLAIPIFSLVAYFLGGYLLTPLLIFIHKKLIGRNLIYGIEDHHKSKEIKKIFLNSFFPALLALNIGILLSDVDVIHNFIFPESFQASVPGPVLHILTLTFLLPFVSSLGIGISSAVYFLIDSGIEYTNKEQKKVKQGSFPVEVRSMGGYYLYYLKGYAGISVILSIAKLIFAYFTSFEDPGSIIYIMNIIMWPVIPFIIAFFMIPSLLIQDFTYQKRKDFVKKWAQKCGINNRLDNPLGRS